jgi:hypothetical protein
MTAAPVLGNAEEEREMKIVVIGVAATLAHLVNTLSISIDAATFGLRSSSQTPSGARGLNEMNA